MILNASRPAKVFYGLHFEPGCAEYQEPDQEPYKILISEDTIRSMNASFAGKPVYVHHVDRVNLSNVENEAAGWVVESFFNAADGKTWVKFIIVSDDGFQAIERGWKLSNAYVPKGWGVGGTWHGMDYQREVVSGEYEHLAIVPNPRYESSIILDAEGFQTYNESKAAALKIANSNQKKEQKMGILNLFKREKVENSLDLEQLSIVLPQSKVEKTITEVVEIADRVVNMSGYACDEHMVKVNDDEEMSVNDLRKSFNKMRNAEKERMAEEEAKKNADEEAKKNAEAAPKEEEEKKENQDEEAKKNEDEEEVKKNEAHFDSLRNAIAQAQAESDQTVVMNSDRVAQGKRLFGSGK